MSLPIAAKLLFLALGLALAYLSIRADVSLYRLFKNYPNDIRRSEAVYMIFASVLITVFGLIGAGFCLAIVFWPSLVFEVPKVQ